MILPLRRVHRSAFLALALLLPALLASAWKVRRGTLAQALAPELLPVWSPDSEWPARAHGDELVYWTSAAPDDSSTLPADAELVGTVSSGAYGLQPPPGKRAITYSLAHGERISLERSD